MPTPARPTDDELFVAVGRKSERTLAWALADRPAAGKVVLVHVHCPSKRIPVGVGGSFQESHVSEKLVKAYRLREREQIDKELDKYMRICQAKKVVAEKLVIQMDDVSEGLVDVIARFGITRLVMGAAADKRYSKKMNSPRSTTACTVQKEAHPSCNIWFVCRGHLICVRKARQDDCVNQQNVASVNNSSPQSESFSLKPVYRGSWFNPVHGLFRNRSSVSSCDGKEAMDPSPNESTAHSPTCSSWSGSEGSGTKFFFLTREGGSSSTHCQLDGSQTSCAHEQQGKLQIHELRYKLQQASPELITLNGEAANRDSRKQHRTESEALMASHKVKDLQLKYLNEMKQRKEIEKALAREKMERDSLKSEKDKIFDELVKVQDQKLKLETQVTKSSCVIEDLKEKLSSMQHHFNLIRLEKEALHQKCDNATKEVEKFRSAKDDPSSSSSRLSDLSEFSYAELEQATQNFESSLIIGEGGYGKVYRGSLRKTTVAIKILHACCGQGQSEFQHEINILSRVRHPNLVTLIGACSEVSALVYEYLPNGSLEDRLACIGNSPPISWEVRICILVEICGALIFLHFNKPQSVVHGDLKPANILLDVNYRSKLCDFGMSRLLSQSSATSTFYCMTNPKGSIFYMDPEFYSSGLLTPMSDVYSFGIILLQLLTRKSPVGIVKEVQEALNKGTLQEILDPTAGTWPFVQAQQLAGLGLRCCEMSRNKRPDLTQEIWPILEAMKNDLMASPSG